MDLDLGYIEPHCNHFTQMTQPSLRLQTDPVTHVPGQKRHLSSRLHSISGKSRSGFCDQLLLLLGVSNLLAFHPLGSGRFREVAPQVNGIAYAYCIRTVLKLSFSRAQPTIGNGQP
jgi:hypothetical protein